MILKCLIIVTFSNLQIFKSFLLVRILLILCSLNRPFQNFKSPIFRQSIFTVLKPRKLKDINLVRRNARTLLLNNRELQAIEAYCKKYKVDNKSKFMRETIISEVLRKFDSDYPTLFELEKPNLFSR
jgi:hypothetical protein